MIISRQALKRIRERFEGPEFTSDDVYWILETGTIRDRPARENASEWKVILQKRIPGTHDAGAVTLIAQDNGTLFIKTVNVWICRHDRPLPLH